MLQFIKSLFTPLVQLAMLLLGFAGWVAAAVSAPKSFFNMAICWMIDIIAAVLPSTPENLKISAIIAGIANKMPAAGTAIIWEILSTFGIIMGIMMVIKIYRLLPFKFS